MDRALLDTSWIWHPDWVDSAPAEGPATAGGFVHFRRTLHVDEIPTQPLVIQVSADTRYKLYINEQRVFSGPVKGDDRLWFYDEVDIQPYLRPGPNHVAIRVLRFFHATPYATSFPRMPIPGLLVRVPDETMRTRFAVNSDDSWETSLDTSTVLRVDQKEDDFLHVYESVNGPGTLTWAKAKRLNLPKSHGIAPPWVLSPRMIPSPRITRVQFSAVHNVRSPVEQSQWERLLIHSHGHDGSEPIRHPLTLPSGTSHHIELELPHHLTAMLTFRFRRPQCAGSRLTVTYSEAYENKPPSVPYLRSKGDRRDTTKMLIGPQDTYVLGGPMGAETDAALGYAPYAQDEESFAPFHFRTLRFMALDIEVSPEAPLDLMAVEVEMTHYPFDVTGGFTIPDAPQQDAEYQGIWSTSVRTLTNCMHDCYEDCPFYEQLQYAMDLRSSCLFTYAASGDDRMARQAIVQLHNTYRPAAGLLASRGPAHQLQTIPNFSLFWICTVADHFEHAGDVAFTRRFLAACDGVLESFARRVDPVLGLVASTPAAVGTAWDFVDWTHQWRPMGIPPAAERTGFQTFTSMLYAYTLRLAAAMTARVGRPSLAAEYEARADAVAAAVKTHAYRAVDRGHLFTDGLAAPADLSCDLSQHCQVWAVLSGAVTGDAARELLARALVLPGLTKPSTAMSFYVLRALSKAGGPLYDEGFHGFWAPWRAQMGENLTTWCEDDVTQRSDCHAWSCAALYEFTAEVAGVRPAEAGWSAVSWRPRVGLFGQFEGSVPLGGVMAPGVAHVSWTRGLRMALELRGVDASKAGVPIHVELPDGRTELHTGPVVTLQIA